MSEFSKEVENVLKESGWHYWVRVAGLRIAGQITGAIENGSS